MDTEQRWTSLSLLVCCLAVAAAFLATSNVQLDSLFNSDALYLPSIYHDLVHGAGFSGLKEWYFNPAPNFFPDMIAYCLLNWVLGDLRLATYVFALLQVVVIVLLYRGILKEAGVRCGEVGVALGVLLMSLLAMVGRWGGDFNITYQFLINSYHTGAFVNALLATWLLLRWLMRERTGYLVLLCPVVFLAAASDKLFWVMFVVPAVAANLLIAARGHAWKRTAATAVLIYLCTWAARDWLHALDKAFPLDIAKPYAYLAFDRIAHAWQQFIAVFMWYLQGHPLLVWSAALPLLAAPWALWLGVRTLAGLFTRPVEPGHTGVWVVRLMVALFFPIVLFTPVLNGAFDGGDCIRYNFAVFMLAPLVLGVLIAQRSPRMAKWLAGTGAIAFGLPMAWICFTSHPARILTYKPERVAALDRIAAAHHLRNGVADYWDAKVITLFTDEGLTVLPVHWNMAMFVKVNREAMFLRTDGGVPMVFNFVVAHEGLTPEKVSSLLNCPVTVVDDPPASVILTRPWSFVEHTRHPDTALVKEPG